MDINNHHFVVERRHESETDFKEIGNVDANQDFNLAQHDYDFDDYDVNLSGVYYYRIKQIDKNERFTYSRIISIQVKVDESLNAFIYPNPVNDKLKVELWLPEDSELEAKVFDNTEKQYWLLLSVNSKQKVNTMNFLKRVVWFLVSMYFK